MRVSLGELLDRFTIVSLKVERTNDYLDILPEKKALVDAIQEYRDEGVGIDPTWINKLYEINGTIWNLEADIRDGKEGNMEIEEVGRRAIAIRDWNKKRVALKNEINNITKTGFKEIKINHASE